MQRILFLDDSPERCKAARTYIQAECVHTVRELIAALERQEWDEVYLDHDLGDERDPEPGDGNLRDADGCTGMDAATWISAHRPELPVTIHSMNAPAALYMAHALDNSTSIIPFTRLLAAWKDA